MTTRFKIKKVIYGYGKSKYYPMVKRRFWWGWSYMYKFREYDIDGITRYKVNFEDKEGAILYINEYKKGVERRKIIKSETCFYSN